MSKHRVNAPLVEVIAEIRWDLVGVQPAVSGMPALILPNKAESFEKAFEEFGDRVGDDHSHKERMVPPGFPYLSHQPAYRFANRNHGEHNSLFQVGPGVFSAHAVPPYESWSQFSKIIKSGISALIESRNEDKHAPMSSISLRYIDAFRSNLTHGRSTNSFLSEVLGFDFGLPGVLLEQVARDKEITPYCQIRIPMDADFLLLVSIGEGAANGESAIIMDTTVTRTVPMEPNSDSLMKDFDFAHSIIRKIFDNLTQKIGHLMPEIEE